MSSDEFSDSEGEDLIMDDDSNLDAGDEDTVAECLFFLNFYSEDLHGE